MSVRQSVSLQAAVLISLGCPLSDHRGMNVLTSGNLSLCEDCNINPCQRSPRRHVITRRVFLLNAESGKVTIRYVRYSIDHDARFRH